MINKTYNTRTWLNPEKSASTGTVVCFSGNIINHQKKINWTYIEIADCHCKVKLHKTEEDSYQDFINKMIKLRGEIDNFITFLEKTLVD